MRLLVLTLLFALFAVSQATSDPSVITSAVAIPIPAEVDIVDEGPGSPEDEAGIFEDGVEDPPASADGAIPVLLRSAINEDDPKTPEQDVEKYLCVQKTARGFGKMGFKGASNTGKGPFRYNFRKFYFRRFKFGQGRLNKRTGSSFRFKLTDVDMDTRGSYDMALNPGGAGNLYLKGKMSLKVFLTSVKVDVTIGAGGKWKRTRCLVNVKSVDTMLPGTCKMQDPLRGFMRRARLGRKQAVKMACFFMDRQLEKLVKFVIKKKLLR